MTILDNYNITKENLLVVDAKTRDIFIPEDELIFGVEGDALTTWKIIEFPKEVAPNFDVRTATVKISAINANDERFEYTNSESIISVVPVSDTYSQASGGSETKTLVIWNIPGDLSIAPGIIYFSVTLTDPDDNRIWSTIIEQGTILASISSFSTEIDDVIDFDDIEDEIDDIVNDDNYEDDEIYEDDDFEENDEYDYGDSYEEAPD